MQYPEYTCTLTTEIVNFDKQIEKKRQMNLN